MAFGKKSVTCIEMKQNALKIARLFEVVACIPKIFASYNNIIPREEKKNLTKCSFWISRFFFSTSNHTVTWGTQIVPRFGSLDRGVPCIAYQNTIIEPVVQYGILVREVYLTYLYKIQCQHLNCQKVWLTIFYTLHIFGRLSTTAVSGTRRGAPRTRLFLIMTVINNEVAGVQWTHG